ncbi:MAG TPA: AbfB domain-containing protein, partial [Spirochaetota bacterium]|nr:AbfB domain-containing protein [Spirochaetota bacterium]
LLKYRPSLLPFKKKKHYPVKLVILALISCLLNLTAVIISVAWLDLWPIAAYLTGFIVYLIVFLQGTRLFFSVSRPGSGQVKTAGIYYNIFTDWIGRIKAIDYNMTTVSNIIIFALYFLLSFFLIYFHEPWRDESQAWLIARDLPLWSIFSQMRYEGTPALWHFILAPFAKLDFPYFTESVIHWLIACSFTWLLIFKSPFKLITKTAFILSFYFLYEYVAVARNYNLTVLLLFLLAWFYPLRHKKTGVYALLLALLFNANSHSMGAAAALFLHYIIEIIHMRKYRRYWLPVVLVAAAALGAVLQVKAPWYPPLKHSLVNTKPLLEALQGSFFEPYLKAVSKALHPFNKVNNIYFFFYLFMILAVSNRLLPLLTLLLSNLLLVYIFATTHHGSTRHFGLILVFLCYAFWISYQNDKTKPNKKRAVNRKLSKYYPAINTAFGKMRTAAVTVFTLFLLYSSLESFRFYTDDIKYQYSGAEEAAAFLLKEGNKNKLLTGYKTGKVSSIAPYLSRCFYYPQYQDFGSFSIWDKKQQRHFSDTMLVDHIRKKFKTNINYLLVITHRLKAGSLNKHFKLVFHNRKKIFQCKRETYFIYAPVALFTNKKKQNWLLKPQYSANVFIGRGENRFTTVRQKSRAFSFYLVKGLWGKDTVSIAVAGKPGYYLRHRNFVLHEHMFRNNRVFKKD